MNRADLGALLGSAILVPLVWLGLGWSPLRLVMGYDAVTALLPMVAALREAGGDFRALAWRDEFLGGVAVRDTLGPQPWLALLAAAGLSPTSILNGATFGLQALFAFFGQRLTADITRLLGGVAWPTALRVLMATLLVAFAPFVGWRVGHGHLSLLLGLLPFLATLSILAASLATTRTTTLTLAAAAAIASGVPFVGQQTLLFGFVFGAPLFLGLWHCGTGDRRAPRGALLVLLSGLLLATPGYAPMLAHAFGSDALRELGGTSVTYGYVTARPVDWLTSLPWARLGLWGRPEIHYHETNVPLGPLVLLLALLPRRGRPLVIAILASVLLAVAFASNVHPLSDLLLWALPPLHSFRVPTRALMPVLLVLPAVVSAGCALRGAPPRRASAFGGLGLLVILLALPPLPREILIWALVVWIVWQISIQRGILSIEIPAVALALALTGASLASFRDRLLPFPESEVLLAEARAMGDRARQTEPSTLRPLTRVAMNTDHAPLGANAVFAAGLSSLDGYGFPQRRFVALVRALRGEPYAPSALLLRFREDYPGSRVLFQLYNVSFAVGSDGSSRPLGKTAGAAWFPAEVGSDATVYDLANVLLEWGDHTHERARRTLRVVRGDPDGLEALRVPVECEGARVIGLAKERNGGLSVEVRTPGLCPLVLARNYGRTLRAWDGRDHRALRTFPAYGALLGVLVPTGTTHLSVRPEGWPPTTGLLGAAAGLLVLALALRKGG